MKQCKSLVKHKKERRFGEKNVNKAHQKAKVTEESRKR